MTEGVDEQVDRHDRIAVEVRPEGGQLWGAPGQGDVVAQIIDAHERGPGDPADQRKRRTEGGKPGCTPHTEQGHSQIAYGEEEGGGDPADEVQHVANRASLSGSLDGLAEKTSRPE